jgi:hypothetical protein
LRVVRSVDPDEAEGGVLVGDSSDETLGVGEAGLLECLPALFDDLLVNSAMDGCGSEQIEFEAMTIVLVVPVEEGDGAREGPVIRGESILKIGY